KSQSTSYDERMPGVPTSREPVVDSALVYFGHLDGQTIDGGFNTLLNWRKDSTCTSTLCATAADPAACRAASTDFFKEIDTRCVGVAPGFMGYNFQSFPLSNFSIWPTGWNVTTDQGPIDAPRVATDRGVDDSFSAWFDKPDEVATPLCYPYANGIL